MIKILSTKIVAAIVPLVVFTTSALGASFTTVDISSYVNSNVSLNPQTVPTGTSTGNQGTGIAFNVATFGQNNYEGTWNPLYGSGLDVQVSVTGQASFYALLNNYYGTPGADEYDITIKATNGDSVTYQSIGGVDTRDYNSNVYTNSIANTTFPWFNNGVGQRFDVREFAFPSSFASETISDFIITQVDPSDPVLFTGLTFSSLPLPTPEPITLSLFAGGLAIVGLARVRKNKIK